MELVLQLQNPLVLQRVENCLWDKYQYKKKKATKIVDKIQKYQQYIRYLRKIKLRLLAILQSNTEHCNTATLRMWNPPQHRGNTQKKFLGTCKYLGEVTRQWKNFSNFGFKWIFARFLRLCEPDPLRGQL